MCKKRTAWLYRWCFFLHEKAREESFLVPAKAGAHARQAQLFHQVSMSVVDVNHLNSTRDYHIQPEEHLSVSQLKQEHMPGRRSCSTSSACLL
jgi:hypothetical protein